MNCNCNIAYLSQGKLHLKIGEEPPRVVESQYGQTIRDRAVKAQQRHAWKSGGEGDKFLSSEMLWGKAARDGAAIRIAITSICRGPGAGQVYYSLETDAMCGLLAVDNLGAEERRVWSNNTQRLRHLNVNRDRGDLACSVEHKFGTANIGVMLADGTGLMEATEGDSYDTAPRWVPGERRRIVYQSAGVGRNRDGHYAGLSPYSVQVLDLDSGEVECLVEEPRHDLLTPQMTKDGTLYYIRRPYVTGREVRPLTMVKDVLLFPFRMVNAIFHYLDFFSMTYSGKKLTTSGGARGREMDMKQMMIWGNLVQAQNAAPAGEEPVDLVPKSWELMRKRSGTPAQVVAKGVLSFDIAEDESVIYSNGNAIFRVDASGARERILLGHLIEQVVALDAAGK